VTPAAPPMGLSDADLVERAVRNARPRGTGKFVRWSAVGEAFGLGSTSSMALCKRFGLNPDDQIDGPVCEVCVENYFAEND
jgi:hypothetical protein